MSCEAGVSRFGSRLARQIASGEPTIPSTRGLDVPVENHQYPCRTEPSRVGCVSGEPPVPVPYRALAGRMCQWRTTRTRAVPSSRGSDVPVENHLYPCRTELSRVRCASGEGVYVI
ncbi:UNVERIFIED_CONTAM: hypothetical protein FKN15_014115 [Acipenser sinensis]